LNFILEINIDSENAFYNKEESEKIKLSLDKKYQAFQKESELFKQTFK
jgi:hypothetical protein